LDGVKDSKEDSKEVSSEAGKELSKTFLFLLRELSRILNLKLLNVLNMTSVKYSPTRCSRRGRGIPQERIAQDASHSSAQSGAAAGGGLALEPAHSVMPVCTSIIA
ncbi:hypothetical protein cypCar_00020841, partial [Cyprinus carpio]